MLAGEKRRFLFFDVGFNFFEVNVRLLVVFATGRGATGFLVFLYPTSTEPKEDPLQRCLSQAETKCGQKEVDRGPRANREALYLAPQRGSWEQSIRSFLEHSPAVVSEVGQVAGCGGLDGC